MPGGCMDKRGWGKRGPTAEWDGEQVTQEMGKG